jgi:DNA-binding transcriptional MerR regulator
MDDGDRAQLTIGQLARRTGLPVRTIRYWSDIGAVRASGRTAGGYRLYDAEAVARLELVRTLRELGIGLTEVRRVLDLETTVAQVAAVHVAALDAQIRGLRLRRAVLATVAKRASTTEEMALMNKLARLSAEERKRLIDDFVDEVFSGLQADQGLAGRLRQAPDLPEDPTPEQVDAWVELAELVSDLDFRRRIRAMAVYGATEQAPGGLGGSGDPEENMRFVSRVTEHGGEAVSRGVAPESAEGAEVLRRILGDTPDEHLEELRRHLEVFTDARAERYWQLVGIIKGWPPFPARVPAFEWVIAGLRGGAPLPPRGSPLGRRPVPAFRAAGGGKLLPRPVTGDSSGRLERASQVGRRVVPRMVATRVRVAAAGSGAAATAETTATPAAPASSTCRALDASIPPMPTTGSRVAALISRTRSSPTGAASGLVLVGNTVTPR